ncbi:MAG: hypothetical protein Q7T56_11415 [Nocardioidaceae bacterium]|nr:hypothetical protein [Nocardioidaceae bacterium]
MANLHLPLTAETSSVALGLVRLLAFLALFVGALAVLAALTR